MNFLLEVHEVFTASQSANASFDYIVDYSRINEWDHTILESEKIGNDPVKLGTRFELLYSRSDQKIPISYEITEFTAPNKAVLTGTNENFTAIDIITIKELETGCRIDWQAKVEFIGLQKPLDPTTVSAIKNSMAETLHGLKTTLDGQV